MDYADIVERISRAPMRYGRRIVAIAGAPASGKSKISKELQSLIPNSCVVPMDGFHRSNDDLNEHGLLSRKGAPETFDVAGFSATLRSIRTNAEVAFPTFDRETDSVVVRGGMVRKTDKTILVEGNYLLYSAPPWNKLAEYWDLSIMLDVPFLELQKRLIQRWLAQGYDSAGAVKRAEGNDLPNARIVVNKGIAADITVPTY